MSLPASAAAIVIGSCQWSGGASITASMSFAREQIAEVVVSIAALVLASVFLLGVMPLDFLFRRLAAVEIAGFLVTVAAAIDVANGDTWQSDCFKNAEQIRKTLIADADAADIDAIARRLGTKDRGGHKVGRCQSSSGGGGLEKSAPRDCRSYRDDWLIVMLRCLSANRTPMRRASLFRRGLDIANKCESTSQSDRCGFGHCRSLTMPLPKRPPAPKFAFQTSKSSASTTPSPLPSAAAPSGTSWPEVLAPDHVVRGIDVTGRRCNRPAARRTSRPTRALVSEEFKLSTSASISACCSRIPSRNSSGTPTLPAVMGNVCVSFFQKNVPVWLVVTGLSGFTPNLSGV